MTKPDSTALHSRRRVLRLGAMAAAGCLIGRVGTVHADSSSLPLITKPIPSSGEMIPVVGLGTNSYSVSSAEDLASRREVLRHMPELGGTVVDTAPGYGRSEEVIGQLVAEIGNRDKLFLATKVTAPDGDPAAGRAMLEQSLQRLRVKQLDLVQVHSLRGMDTAMPVLEEWKAAKRIRYHGATTSNVQQHAQMEEAMRRHRLDFVQLNYSIDDRAAADRLLPLAQERGTAILVNLPFGGRRGNILQRVAGRELPAWAAEIDAKSWAQFFLKYTISHPAVTCAIPGTTRLTHLEDNQLGARGNLPDAAMRKRMEQYWESLA